MVKAARWLRQLFDGDLIARMTEAEDTDIHRDVKHLLGLKPFDHVYWQLNVIWSGSWDFSGWVGRSYLPGLERIMEEWVYKLKEGEVLGVAPFQGMLKWMKEGGHAPFPSSSLDATIVVLSIFPSLLASTVTVCRGTARLQTPPL